MPSASTSLPSQLNFICKSISTDKQQKRGRENTNSVNMQPNHATWAWTTVSQKLSEFSVAQPECTIYRVHEDLRNISSTAYEPKVIAIGPYHRNNDNLKMMEDHKLRYLHLLQQENGNVEEYFSVIGQLEQEARNCYANPISLEGAEFIEMLVLDGCFIIELVRKCNMPSSREKKDRIFRTDWIINSLQRDLMLFENQIPFFVLCKLFDLIEVPNNHGRLMHLLTSFFKTLHPHPGEVCTEIISSHEIRHLLGLIHINLLSSFDPSDLDEALTDGEKQLRFIANATWLRDADVEFERNENVSLLDIKFEHGTMSLPPLTIEDRTESFLRNLIAYEQYFHGSGTSYVTDYVKFLDCLIDSSKDVEILSRFGIIYNWLGDAGVVANMFNKLTDSVAGPGSGFIYAKIFDKVNEHCNKRRNRWMGKLRRNYLNSPWAIISIIVAVVLLLLTITQTVFSILQVV